MHGGPGSEPGLRSAVRVWQTLACVKPPLRQDPPGERGAAGAAFALLPPLWISVLDSGAHNCTWSCLHTGINLPAQLQQQQQRREYYCGTLLGIVYTVYVFSWVGSTGHTERVVSVCTVQMGALLRLYTMLNLSMAREARIQSNVFSFI